MRARFLALLIGGGLLLGGGSAWAQSGQSVSIAAEATPSEVGTAGTVTFAINVRGVPLSAIETPEPPPTTNLALQDDTPVTQRKLSFDSGRLQRRITFKWRYRPLRIGVGRLDPVSVRIDGEAYETDEVRVRIVDQAQRGRASRLQRAAPRRSAPSSGAASTQPELAPRDVFIRATASADTAYQNQQVTVEYRLFFRPNVRLRRSHMADAWDAPGFWREELDVASRILPDTRRLHGRAYKSIVLKRVALFPTRPGRLTVDPMQIETEARAEPELGARNERPARSYYEPMSLTSERLVVHAKALPAGAPDAFDGAVGHFSMDTEVSRDSVAVGTGIEVRARIQGGGNLATVSPPLVDVPSDFVRYDPTVDTHIERSDSTIRGQKTFTYTMVPKANGDYVLPPVRFSYFDPEAERYETLRSAPTPLRVTGERAARAVGEMRDGLPIGDIAGPMSANGAWVSIDRGPLYAQPWAYAVLLAPLALAAGAVAYRRRRGHEAAKTDEGAGAALDRAQQRLQVAEQRLRNEDGEPFYRALEETMLTFLDQRLDLPRPVPRMTADAIERELRRHEVPAADRTALRELIDTCTQAQFGPSEPSTDARAATLQQAQALLPRLDESLSH